MAEHDYFDSLVASAEHVADWSLRSQAQLDSLAIGGGPSTDALYLLDDGDDTHYDPQDGARVRIQSGAEDVQGLRLPLSLTSGRALVYWEAWHDNAWIYHQQEAAQNQKLDVHQVFQLHSNGQPWLSVRNRYDEGTTQTVGFVDCRGFGANRTEGQVERLEPNVADVVMHHGQWMRFWLEVVFGTPATCSLWVADGSIAPTKVLDAATMDLFAQDLSSLDLLYLADGTRTGGEELTSYVRNVAVLAGVTDPPSLFESPEPALELESLPRLRRQGQEDVEIIRQVPGDATRLMTFYDVGSDDWLDDDQEGLQVEAFFGPTNTGPWTKAGRAVNWTTPEPVFQPVSFGINNLAQWQGQWVRLRITQVERTPPTFTEVTWRNQIQVGLDIRFER